MKRTAPLILLLGLFMLLSGCNSAASSDLADGDAIDIEVESEADMAEPDAEAEIEESGESETEREVESEVEGDEVVPLDQDQDGLPDDLEAAKGCDPQKPDTDQDGTNDADEVQAGTMCNDPFSAPPWPPAAHVSGVHPHLAAVAEDLPRLKRLLADDALFQRLLLPVKAAAQAPDPTTTETEYDPVLAEAQGIQAKNAAFLHWLGVEPAAGAERYAEKAKRLLGTFETDLSQVTLSSKYLDQVTIQTSAALVYFCQAFDFLAAAGALDTNEYASLRSRILTLGTGFFDAYFVRMSYTLPLFQNNHSIKAATGIGMVALLFPEAPQSALLIQQALSAIDYYHLNHQVCPGGANAEGPAYFEYTMINLRGFGVALQRIANGQPLSIVRQCRALPNECVVGAASIPDVLFSKAHRQVVEDWLPNLWLPLGYVANIDDSDLVSYNWAFDAFLYKSPTARWFWEAAASPQRINPSDAPETLVLYDPALVAEKPPLTSGLHEGYARLAVDTGDSEGLLALLIGERDESRMYGIGHEQPDNQSLILSAKNELWLMDSGYFSHKERDKVAGAANHNVILVDGKGGPMNVYNLYGTDNDAALSMPVEPPVAQAVSSLSRQSVDLSRHLMLLDERVGLVVDRMAPTDTALHRYELLFQLNGGGTTDGRTGLLERGASLTRGTTRLLVAVNANAEFESVALNEQTHSFFHSFQQHDRLTIAVQQAKSQKPSLVCTALSFTTEGQGTDPNEGFEVEAAESVSPHSWCWAASLDEKGDTRFYVWRSEGGTSACFSLSRRSAVLASPAEPLGDLCGSGQLMRLLVPQTGPATAEAIGQGTAAWTPKGQR